MTCPHGSPVGTPCLECAADAARGYCSRCHGAPHRTGECEPPTLTTLTPHSAVQSPLVDHRCSQCRQRMTTSHICRAAAHDVVVSEHFRTVRLLTDDPLGFSAERAAQGEADAATARTRPLTEAMHVLRDRVGYAGQVNR